jgi:hypothetical protein
MRAVVALAAAAALAQGPPPADPLAPVRFLAGRWTGEASGQPGKGVSEREYRFELRGRFLSGRSRTAYEPRPGKTAGEVHEDWSMLNYDRISRAPVLRQFHVEGFVNEYRLTSHAPDRLEFTSFHIDNLPEGWRAREVWRIVSADEFIETFSIAEPGQDFKQYSETRLKRAR